MNMKQLIENFPSQMREAMTIGETFKATSWPHEIKNGLETGLGGSGIGGTIVSQLCEKEMPIPFMVNKDYFMPAFVNKHSLVVVSSYSGNTEETLHAMDMAIKQGAKVVCVSSGGKTVELAKQHGLDHILIPGGMPPRSCYGYSSTQLFYILHAFKLIGDGFKASLKNAVDLLDAESANIKNASHKLASELIGKIPVIYSASNNEGVVVRFRQQVQENGKMLCWHHVFPEMTHNELVGWTQPHNDIAVVLFRDKDDFFRTAKRMDICKEIFGRYTPHIYEVWSKGGSPIEKAIYLIHFGDWTSWYLSEIRNIDCTEVKVIDYLKSEMAKLN